MTLLLSLLPAFSAARACEPLDVAAVVAEAERAAATNPNDGLVLLEQAWNRLPEACTPPPRSALALVAQKLAWFNEAMGRSDFVASRLEDACRVAPGVEVPDTLGKDLRAQGLLACERVEKFARGKLHATRAVRVNGAVLEEGESIELPVGQHVVYWQEGEAWVGAWRTVERDETLDAPGPPPGPVVESEPEPTERPVRQVRSLAGPVVLVGGGAALIGAGAAVLQLVFAEAWNTHCAPAGYDFLDGGFGGFGVGVGACEADEGVSLQPAWYGGLGLVVGGAALGGAGLTWGGVTLVPRLSVGQTSITMHVAF